VRVPTAGAWVVGAMLALVASGADAAPGPAGLDLAVARTRPLQLSPALAGGALEHRELGVHGVPIRGAYETVRTRPEGGQELLASRYPVAPPQLRPSDARIPATLVPALVAAHRGMEEQGEPQLERPPELVYILVLGQPVLVWETQLALTLWPEPSRPTVWVSAASGRVLREVEQVRTSRARVFEENPSKTPEPIDVELYDIHVQDAGHPLTGPRVQAFNCLAEEPAEVSPWWDEDECWPVQTVFSDANGDFTVPTPDVVRMEDNVDPSDPYAELSMYVHAERFFEAMRQKGVEQFRCEFASMLANVRNLEPSSSFDYGPLNNAYYTDQCDPEEGPTMLFGQGSEVDFGYDGDVVYHELGHGMVALLTPDGLSELRLRPDGTVSDASGLNEALADYFSVMLTDDPHLAEYVGRFWSGNGGPYIRDAENGKRCPEDTIGQSHNDGEPFMAALWATRKRLSPAGKAAMDQAVLAALMQMPPDADLEAGAELVLETFAQQVQLGALSADEHALLVRSFDARGLLGCPRVITDPKRVRDGRAMHLRRVDDGIYPFYPGPTQLRYEVPPDADDMVVTFSLKASSGSDPVEARVLVKRGDEPIAYEYQLVAVDDPPVDPPEDPAEVPEDPVQEVVLVTGDWDLELSATLVAENDYLVELGGLLPGEVLYVTLVDVAPDNATASGVSLRSSTALPSDDAGDESGTGTGTGTTGEPDSTAGADLVMPGEGSASCACRTGERPTTVPTWALVAGLLGLRRRRRRGPCGR
jgi:MYXO-CTERM domain-containing protein